jgi:8-oxo-dGTP pyrophosphatase MutT (NUDIX family)
VTFADALVRLETGLRSPLPGPDAQARLAPLPRREWPAGLNPARIRNAAGLLLVYPRSEETAETAKSAKQDSSLRSLRSPRFLPDRDAAHIILTVRADALRHGGQVSLPGGVVDPGETFEQTALREAHEEIALLLDEVRVLGALTPLDIPVSGFRLHPIVAMNPTRPALTASDGEVARILEVSLDELMDPQHFSTTERLRDGVSFTVPAFQVNGVEIWGATAMVLAEFLAVLGWTRHFMADR